MQEMKIDSNKVEELEQEIEFLRKKLDVLQRENDFLIYKLDEMVFDYGFVESHIKSFKFLLDDYKNYKKADPLRKESYIKSYEDLKKLMEEI